MLFFRRRKNHKASRFGKYSRYITWSFRLFLLLLAVDIFYLSTIWPDWDKYNHGVIKKSKFIQEFRKDNPSHMLLWQPVPFSQIHVYIQDAAVIGEDARFFSHWGFDVIAFQEAMNANLERMEMRYGGSTISQQTVKNMFFSSSRTPLRKWHELLFTIGMEINLSKKRILETYLNIAEFDKGIYGVQAAAQHYWGINATQLSLEQAAELAACLPSPRKHNPRTRTKSFLFRVNKIRHYLHLRHSPENL